MSGNTFIVDWAVGDPDSPERHHFTIPRGEGQTNQQWLGAVLSAVFDHFYSDTPCLVVPSQVGEFYLGRITMSYEGATPNPFFSFYNGPSGDPSGALWLADTQNIISLKFNAYPPV